MAASPPQSTPTPHFSFSSITPTQHTGTIIMNTVRFLIMGKRPTDIRFRSGETLQQLINRCADEHPNLQMTKVSTWHANNQPVTDPSTLYLSSGMTLHGAAKHAGG
jgi:hypothetical protein